MKKYLLVLLLFVSCTANQRVKMLGGLETVDLPENAVFVNATWKENQLWIIVHDTVTNEHYMYEKSNYGILEGRVVFK